MLDPTIIVALIGFAFQLITTCAKVGCFIRDKCKNKDNAEETAPSAQSGTAGEGGSLIQESLWRMGNSESKKQHECEGGSLKSLWRMGNSESKKQHECEGGSLIQESLWRMGNSESKKQHEFVVAQLAETKTQLAVVAQQLAETKTETKTQLAVVAHQLAETETETKTQLAVVAQQLAETETETKTQLAVVAQQLAETEAETKTQLAVVAHQLAETKTQFAVVAQQHDETQRQLAVVAQHDETQRQLAESNIQLAETNIQLAESIKTDGILRLLEGRVKTMIVEIQSLHGRICTLNAEQNDFEKRADEAISTYSSKVQLIMLVHCLGSVFLLVNFPYAGAGVSLVMVLSFFPVFINAYTATHNKIERMSEFEKELLSRQRDLQNEVTRFVAKMEAPFSNEERENLAKMGALNGLMKHIDSKKRDAYALQKDITGSVELSNSKNIRMKSLLQVEAGAIIYGICFPILAYYFLCLIGFRGDGFRGDRLSGALQKY